MQGSRVSYCHGVGGGLALPGGGSCGVGTPFLLPVSSLSACHLCGADNSSSELSQPLLLFLSW